METRDKTRDERRRAQLKALGINVSRLREERGVSQKELSLMLGHTNHAHLSRVEAGKKAPSVALLLEVADVLGVSVADLLDGV